MMNEDEAFRQDVRDWLEKNLTGRFAGARGLGGPGREHEAFELRRAWDRRVAAGGWNCVGWPEEFGGRGLSSARQVIFHEEYARADAPVRLGHLGEELLGPTLIALGSPEQQARYLPGIRSAEQLWCQGYSEPGAGSDLAAVTTRAELRAGEWVVTGQKTWTSLAHVADLAFVLCRTEPGSRRHHGLSYLLVPMDQAGVTVRPITQLTGTSEFNEVFFDGARARADDVVGEAGGGWAVAMATLAFERGVSTLGQQVGFRRQLERVVVRAGETGALEDPLLADELARAWLELEVTRMHALRTDGGATGEGQANIAKLLWAGWHRKLGELAMAVEGRGSLVADGPPYDLSDAQRLFLFSRADTIYGGSDEIQRTILAERVLGLPPRAQGNGDMITEYPPGRSMLLDRVVVVTAAAGTGIGSATARRCLDEGARVVISDWHEKRLLATAASLAELTGVKPAAVVCDVTSEAAVTGLIDAAVAEFGRLDVLVNNAGLGGTAALEEMTDDEWGRVLDVTLTGTFRCTRAALRQFRKQSDQGAPGGAIVNNASVLGWRAQPGQAHYAAAKAGVMALTRCAALEAVDLGVRINAVAPSLAMHPFLEKVTTPDLLAELAGREAFGRPAEPWEIATTIAFLASDYASYLTGEVLSVSSQHP